MTTNEYFQQIKELLSNFESNDNLVVSIVLDIINNELIYDVYDKIPEDVRKVLETRDFTQSPDIAKNFLISLGIDENIVSK